MVRRCGGRAAAAPRRAPPRLIVQPAQVNQAALAPRCRRLDARRHQHRAVAFVQPRQEGRQRLGLAAHRARLLQRVEQRLQVVEHQQRRLPRALLQDRFLQRRRRGVAVGVGRVQAIEARQPVEEKRGKLRIYDALRAVHAHKGLERNAQHAVAKTPARAGGNGMRQCRLAHAAQAVDHHQRRAVRAGQRGERLGDIVAAAHKMGGRRQGVEIKHPIQVGGVWVDSRRAGGQQRRQAQRGASAGRPV